MQQPPYEFIFPIDRLTAVAVDALKDIQERYQGVAAIVERIDPYRLSAKRLQAALIYAQRGLSI